MDTGGNRAASGRPFGPSPEGAPKPGKKPARRSRNQAGALAPGLLLEAGDVPRVAGVDGSLDSIGCKLHRDLSLSVWKCLPSEQGVHFAEKKKLQAAGRSAASAWQGSRTRSPVRPADPGLHPANAPQPPVRGGQGR